MLLVMASIGNAFGSHSRAPQCCLKRLRASPCSRTFVKFVSLVSLVTSVREEKAGAWQYAMLVFDTIQQLAMVPDTISLNAVLSAMEKSQRWTQAGS